MSTNLTPDAKKKAHLPGKGRNEPIEDEPVQRGSAQGSNPTAACYLHMLFFVILHVLLH